MTMTTEREDTGPHSLWTPATAPVSVPSSLWTPAGTHPVAQPEDDLPHTSTEDHPGATVAQSAPVARSRKEPMHVSESHRDALAALPRQVDQIRYVCAALGHPETAEVRRWLDSAGLTVDPRHVARTVEKWRAERELPDTDTFAAITAEMLASATEDNSPPAPSLEPSPVSPESSEDSSPESPASSPESPVPSLEPSPVSPESSEDSSPESPVSSPESPESSPVLSPVSPVSLVSSEDSSPESPESSPMSSGDGSPVSPAPSLVSPVLSEDNSPVSPESPVSSPESPVLSPESPESSSAPWQVSPVLSPVSLSSSEGDTATVPVASGVVAPETEATPEQASAPKRVTAPGAWGFYVVAVVSLMVSVDTSWRYFRDEIGITNVYERAAMFSVLELALIAAGFGMAANVRRGRPPGAAQMFAWSLCAFAGYMAWQLSGPGVGVARVVLGPVIGMVALHLALGIERQARAPRTGVWARVFGELRERLLTLLHIADDDRDAAQRTRDQAAARVARLALGGWVPFRAARLRRAIRTSGAAHDPAAKARMLAELDAERHIGQLATLERPSPWV